MEATRVLPSVFQTFGVNPFHPKRLDALLERTAQHQYQRTLWFSAVIELMHSVVLGVGPTV